MRRAVLLLAVSIFFCHLTIFCFGEGPLDFSYGGIGWVMWPYQSASPTFIAYQGHLPQGEVIVCEGQTILGEINNYNDPEKDCAYFSFVGVVQKGDRVEAIFSVSKTRFFLVRSKSSSASVALGVGNQFFLPSQCGFSRTVIVTVKNINVSQHCVTLVFQTLSK